MGGLLHVSGVGWGWWVWLLHRIVIVVIVCVWLVGCVGAVVVVVVVIWLLVLLLWALGLCHVSSRWLLGLLLAWDCVITLLYVLGVL